MNETQSDAEAGAADRAREKEVADQERRIRRLEYDADTAKARTQNTVDLLHKRRNEEADLRERLALARTQLWHLQHPAQGVVVGCHLDGGTEQVREQLDEHAHRALQGGAL